MRLSVDGHPVDVTDGATLLDAVRAAGLAVPTLCHDDRLSTVASCRTCLVEVAGRGLAAACSTPAQDGLVIAVEASRPDRRAALEAIVAGLPPRALDAYQGGPEADRSELARECAEHGVRAPAGAVLLPVRGVDHSHPYVKLDRDLCIACGRCVRACAEIQGTFALTLVGRGAGTVVAPGTGGPWAESDCVSCGACVDTCPTGALSEPGLLDLQRTTSEQAPSEQAPSDQAPSEQRTTTTCGYCGVGCTLEVATRGSSIMTVKPAMNGSLNRGHACVKGRFAHGFLNSAERLSTPLIRRNGTLTPATWDEAIGFVAGRLTAVRDADPDGFALISSARATNEENYLAQKFARAVMGTNNVDNCSRLCHAPSATGLAAAFGLGGGTNPFDDLDACDAILLVGANPTAAHPVVGSRIFERVMGGARLVVVDPRRTYLARHAAVHLRPRPGTNVAVFNGLAHVLVREGMTDSAFLAAHATGYKELRVLLEDYPPDRVAAISGVPAEDLVQAARLYGQAAAPAIFYGLGVTEHLHGTDGVRTLSNLAVLRGAVGPGGGGGVNPLRGQNNVQGASDMGALPDLLPGYQKVGDPAARDRCAAAWRAEVPARPGLRIPQMFAAARSGALQALWIIGEDVLTTDPDSTAVRAALEACPLVICNDLFLSDTAAAADVVFPVAAWLEKEGTFVNFDRRFQRVREAVAPPAGVRTDFAVLHAVADRMGAGLGCETPADAMAECAAVAPLFGGVTHSRLDREGPLHWPCGSPDSPGTARLYEDRFATPDGLAHLAARPYLPPGEECDGQFPFLLITGRRAEHYNSGSMTRRTANLRLLGRETVDVGPGDAAALGVGDGDTVRVASRHGEAVLQVKISDDVEPGQVFAGFHFPGAAVNGLTSPVGDEATGCPEYKVTAVRLAASSRSAGGGPSR
ncbi:formate dehydrogenase subunit alpha [Arthrobacter sp. FW306-07-I]|uniref:formate dehydrogenase subunit alpha n=1 Tax=Arthrobacter sp. FW306-07-I TaxID=2879622 RepID=UPI001EFF69AB|nr:formate dehydrogenase subunit alpha [Arthrobacter sp. FW306-07-I]UKA76413.1 formate dehydrogenase subunit alpha [Arthrobacter sp. FW306-07-I]